MIRNDQQLAIAEAKLAQFQVVLDATVDEHGATSLRDLLCELHDEIDTYKRVKGGEIHDFVVSSLDDLGPALCNARIAAGLSQAQLADRLGISAQMVQKDEARAYEHAGLAKTADVLDALGYQFVGQVVPQPNLAWPQGPMVDTSRVVADSYPQVRHARPQAYSLPPGSEWRPEAVSWKTGVPNVQSIAADQVA